MALIERKKCELFHIDEEIKKIKKEKKKSTIISIQLRGKSVISVLEHSALPHSWSVNVCQRSTKIKIIAHFFDKACYLMTPNIRHIRRVLATRPGRIHFLHHFSIFFLSNTWILCNRQISELYPSLIFFFFFVEFSFSFLLAQLLANPCHLKLTVTCVRLIAKTSVCMSGETKSCILLFFCIFFFFFAI